MKGKPATHTHFPGCMSSPSPDKGLAGGSVGAHRANGIEGHWRVEMTKAKDIPIHASLMKLIGYVKWHCKG